jgi:xanthine dehydrogenase accessory factor
MSNQLTALLDAWQRGRNDTDWVLGTVYKTEGSAYRKAGAMMLINGFGQQFGLLSGGCLEADILRHARKVMQGGRALLLEYDGSDEDDWSFKLGIGCGGKVYIMLQALGPENDLGLGDLAAALERRRSGVYHQKIGAAEAYFEHRDTAGTVRSVIDYREDGEWLVSPINPEPHLLVDPRSANAQRAYFPAATTILRELDASLSTYLQTERVDAAVIMSHNVDIDAAALGYCQDAVLDYVALLGPRHRFRQVLKRAGLDENRLACPVSAPAGLDIGGQLPESISLSILAECHAVLHQSKSVPTLRLAAT